MSYFALIIKYKSGGCVIPLRRYSSRPAAQRSAARRLRRDLRKNNKIDCIYIIEQPSIFDVCDIDVKQYV